MATPLATQSVERSAIRKVAVRLVPFVALMFFINYLDRTAISFAGPNGMNDDLGLTAAQFGFASGIFFVGYILLEIPSNMALYKVGARRWLARIMVCWGIVSLLFTFVQNVPSLYALRILLGVAEAGFFPGAILFLSLWVPARYRSKILALFYLAQPLTTVIGAPLAGLLIKQHGVFGLEGWRFMFLCVSIPAILVGVIAWFYLADSPRQAKWLTPDEAEWLTGETESEAKNKASHGSRGISWRPSAAAGSGCWPSSTSDSSTGCTRSRSSCPPSSPASRSSSAPSSTSSRRASSPRSRTCRPPWCSTSGHATPPGAACGPGTSPTRLRRRTQHPARAVHGFARRDHRRDHRDGVRHLRGAAELLDGARQVPHRRRGRRGHRADQHLRQRGRLRRRIRHRLAQGSDRSLHGRCSSSAA